MTGRNLLPLAVALALSSCHQITAPEPRAGVASNRLLSVSDEGDSLRFALVLAPEMRAQDWEGWLTLDDGSGRVYGAEYPNATSRYTWPIYWNVYGYGRQRTDGHLVRIDRGALVRLSVAWADVGVRRALAYSFDLDNDHGSHVATFAGTFTPDAVASR